jgi:hypothetical protein
MALFAFTADATDFRPFPNKYAELPLRDAGGVGVAFVSESVGLQDATPWCRSTPTADKCRMPVGKNGAAGKWLRENPHRLSLARIGFVLTRRDGTPAKSPELTDVNQRLDLWSGTSRERFSFDRRRVRVFTWAHPSPRP